MGMNEQRRTVVRAVRQSDLERLTGLGAATAPTCFVCQRLLAADEIGGFVKFGTRLWPFCNRVECLVAAQSGRWRSDAPGEAPHDS